MLHISQMAKQNALILPIFISYRKEVVVAFVRRALHLFPYFIQACPLPNKSGPLTSKACPLTNKACLFTNKACPFTNKAYALPPDLSLESRDVLHAHDRGKTLRPTRFNDWRGSLRSGIAGLAPFAPRDSHLTKQIQRLLVSSNHYYAQLAPRSTG